MFPSDYSYRSVIADSTDSLLLSTNTMLSNVVTEVILQADNLVWLGTGLGISIISDSLSVKTLQDTLDLTNGSYTTRIPRGGISAMTTGDQGGPYEKFMFAAAAGSENDIPIGKGIVFTTDATDSTINWVYYDQPIDDALSDTIPFGDIGFVAVLPVTVPQANVTYDMDLSEEFAWTASWAGGLRRFKFIDQVWERVPLPMDNQYELTTCKDTSYIRIGGRYILKDYYLNPRDPLDGGNHNHKAFSVLSYSDTIWVGTANGINRGILGSGNCIDWEHYSYPMDNLSGNFVVGLEIQRLNGKRIIWAATVNADDPTEKRGISYTIDDGLSWNTALLGERIYNIAAFDSLVFAASANGLWKTEDGINWALYRPAHQAIPFPNTAIYDLDEVLADEVYSVAFDNRSYYGDGSIWIGTGDGAAHSYDLDGLNWKIFRAEYDINEDYAYPNPFSPYTHNVLNDNGYVRFHTNEWSGTFVIDIDIYNFAMEKVYATSFDKRISSSGTLKWDGRDQQGVYVHNGVYFVKLTYPENQSSKPSPHWVKLIVVK
ncbi:uncharacterized protein METZ01_LOCUS10717 [marine metagenome]|uniref:FlgD Ig-like domain-containing protein n=1 Tax=marine metagenome TaxID=408172 RepID=A0A381NWK7_9ZZZZ